MLEEHHIKGFIFTITLFMSCDLALLLLQFEPSYLDSLPHLRDLSLLQKLVIWKILKPEMVHIGNNGIIVLSINNWTCIKLLKMIDRVVNNN